MTIPLRLRFHGIGPSEAIERRVRERVDQLSRYHDRIIDCHVVVESPHHHRRHGRIYQLHIDVNVPGGKLVVNQSGDDKHEHEDVYVAIRDGFRAMERQLKQFAARRSNDVKSHEAPNHGRIRTMFPDYGFIEDAEGNEVYFHRNSVVDGNYESMEVGDEVRLVVVHGESDKGPQASTVRPIGKHHIVE